MAGPLLLKETQKKIEACICKECPYCYEKKCAGCENPAISWASCVICFPHSPNLLHLRET